MGLQKRWPVSHGSGSQEMLGHLNWAEKESFLFYWH